MNRLRENNRRIKDGIMNFFIYSAAGITMGMLVVIIGFILIKGIPHINLDFIKNNYESESQYVDIAKMKSEQKDIKGYIKELGITIDVNSKGNIYIKSIDSNSTVKEAINKSKKPFGLKVKDNILKIGSLDTSGKTVDEIVNYCSKIDESKITMKVNRVGGGIFPMIITTLYIIGLSLAIAAPIGILSAIYLTEYAKPGKTVRLIRLATENLSGIPSIIYGLFGTLFFVITLNMGYSIIAGALTLSIVLLPTIIRTTEETLISIPASYRECSLALGATKLQTIGKVILPNAISGILVAIILSIGRIIGESAALLLTAGTAARIPKSIMNSGATLTVKAYIVAKEEGNIGTAAAIGTVILLLIIILNLISKFITKKLTKTN